MLSGTSDIRTECAVAIAFDYTLFTAPNTGFIEVVGAGNVRKLASIRLGGGFSLKPPEEGDHLGAGTLVVGLESCLVVVAFYDTLGCQIVYGLKPELG